MRYVSAAGWLCLLLSCSVPVVQNTPAAYLPIVFYIKVCITMCGLTATECTTVLFSSIFASWWFKEVLVAIFADLVHWLLTSYLAWWDHVFYLDLIPLTVDQRYKNNIKAHFLVNHSLRDWLFRFKSSEITAKTSSAVFHINVLFCFILHIMYSPVEVPCYCTSDATGG